MDKTLDSVSSNQKYSAVKDEDFEETASEESGIQRAASVLATHEPCQGTWYLAAKFLVSREILAVHLMWLLLLVLSIFCLRFFTSGMSCAVSRLPSDEVFGESGFYQFWRGIGILLKLLQYLFELSVGSKIWHS